VSLGPNIYCKRRSDDHAERREPDALRGEHAKQASARLKHEPATTGGDHEPREVAKQRPQQAACSLGSEIEGHTEAKQTVHWPDGAQVKSSRR